MNRTIFVLIVGAAYALSGLAGIAAGASGATRGAPLVGIGLFLIVGGLVEARAMRVR